MQRRASSPNPYYAGPPSDHFDGVTFFNPDGQRPRGFGDLLRWQFGGGRARWPRAWPSPFPPARPDATVAPGVLRITMIGHATLLIQVQGLNILTDPVWSERVSPLSFIGPKRVNAPGIAFAELPRIDVVLLSHNHYDHLDLTTLARLKAAHDPLVITPLGNEAIIRAAVPDMRIEIRDWGGIVEVNAATVHVEPAHHWSARGGRDRSMALWCGFVVEVPTCKIYFAGDTGFDRGRGYKAIAERHGGVRLAILPIGAYEPRWFMEAQHQNPEEAVKAMQLCKAAFAVGCHWGTFHLTNEPVDEPRQRLLDALDESGIARKRFRPMLPGEVWDVPAL